MSSTFDLAASRFASAETSYRQGRVSEALDLLLTIDHDSVTGGEDYVLLLGVCFARLRKPQEAAQVFEKLLAKNPDCFEAITWMAVLKKNRIEIQEAVRFAKRAVELRPDDAASYGSLGGCYLYLRDAESAIAAFTKAVELSPEVAEHRHNLALGLLMVHRHGEAIPHLRKAISLAPANPQSYLALSGSYAIYGMAGDALDVLSQGLSAIPNSAPLHSAAASAFAMIKNDAAAERHHRSATELSADSLGAYAAWLLNQGRFAESDAIYEAMIQNGPDRPLAYYGLMQSRKTSSAAMVPDMEKLLQDRTIGMRGEMRLHYALGKAYDQLKNYEQAMSHYDSANRLAYALHNAGFPMNAAHFREEHERVLRCYEAIAELSPEGHPSEQPIFIIGMIRSGTTLLDQILSSHAAVASAGELRFWTEESLRLAAKSTSTTANDLRTVAHNYLAYLELLAGSSERITDKMPLNFAYAGIIHRALPNARFLHIRRNPVDTCLSIYTTYFGQGSLFAYNQENIVAYYREYQRMMAIWRTAIPQDRLLELDYEDLISNPETLIPKLIEFCGLPWDEACLHHDQNANAINTPSRWQARQPMYKTSLERWRNYEPWLGDFAQLSAP